VVKPAQPYLVLFCLLWPLVLWSQEEESPEPVNPCASRYIQKVQQEGLRALRLWEVPFFYWDRYQCRKTVKDPAALQDFDWKQLEEDYRRSQRFQGWTSSFTVCVTVLVVMFYLERAFRA
jgi:hypothetical protein